MNTPDSHVTSGKMERLGEQEPMQRSIGELASALWAAIGQGDVDAATPLLREAEAKQPSDDRLDAAIVRGKAMINRAAWMDSALVAMRQDLEEDRFASGMGHFRQAISLSRGFHLLKATLEDQVHKEAAKLLPHNRRVAETMLQEASTAIPAFTLDEELKEKLEHARQDELLMNMIHQAERACVEGKTEEARRKLGELLTAHPGDVRIQERLYALDHPGEVVTKPVTVIEVTAEDVAKPMESAARTLKSEEPDADASSFDSFFKPWRKKLLIAESTWNMLKDFSAVGVTTAMLATAGILIWQHSPLKTTVVGLRSLSQSPTSAAGPPRPMPVVAKSLIPPDEQAWELIKTSNDETRIRLFLTTYPASAHALRARVKLDSMDWDKVDKTSAQALAGYVQQHPDSSYNADAKRLMADSKETGIASEGEAGAEDRTAILQAVRLFSKEQPETLAHAGDGVLDEPVIQGDRATLRYHRLGALDHTFSLVRQDGSWKVRAIR